jgi:hypothetical protein
MTELSGGLPWAAPGVLAQAALNGDVRLPYLWMWILAAAILLAALAWLLFASGPRARSRAHAAEQARRRVQERS